MKSETKLGRGGGGGGGHSGAPNEDVCLLYVQAEEKRAKLNFYSIFFKLKSCVRE